MKRKKNAARICAFTLAVSLIAADVLPVFGAAALEEMTEDEIQIIEDEVQVTGEELADEAGVYIQDTETENIIEETDVVEETVEEPETKTADGLIYVDDALYSGYYMDSAGILYTVSRGVAGLVNGVVDKNTGYYRCDDAGAMTFMTLPQQTVFAAGKAYTGYYMDSAGILYIVSEGAAKLTNAAVDKNTRYYRCDDAGVMASMTLPQRMVFVAGKVYTGYYTDTSGKMYTVTNGIQGLKTGTVKKGSRYYSCNAGKMLTLSKQTLYVNGKVYTGYYLDNADRMYSVKQGTCTLKTGTVKKGSKYYSYTSQNTLKLAKKTLYVKGKVYTGHYLAHPNKMYSVKKGIYTLKTGIVKKGTKYYDRKTKKVQKLARETLYVKGKVYTGHYLARSNKMYNAKKGTCTLKTGTLKKGTKYYSYKAKKIQDLAKETLYVKGKVYTGYYLARSDKMYSVKKGTRTLENGMLDKGTAYYSYRSKKTQKLSQKTLYVNGKAMKGMSEASLETLQRAQAVVARVTNDSMTKEEKLKACFDFVKTYQECSPRTPHYKGMDWPVVYANDMFVDGTGNCCSYGAAFAYMAKAIGYEEVYCCNSGGHGWAEIDGLVYDPEWSKHFHVYSYYALSYDTRTDQNYKGAIAAGLPWMHIKI